MDRENHLMMRKFIYTTALLLISTMLFPGLFSAPFSTAVSAGDSAQQKPLPGHSDFKQRVLPILEQFCYDCHGDGAKKGGFAFDRFKNYENLLADKKLWHKVNQFVSSHVMPPSKKPKPTLQQRSTIVQWIDKAVFYVDPNKPDPGHITLRRLNRTEYNNAVRDIFFLNQRPADQFPPDDSGYGYDNIGDVLSLSPMLMEKYLRAARQVVAQATRVRPVTGVDVLKKGDQLEIFQGPAKTNGTALVLSDEKTEVGIKADLPVPATYRLLLRAASTRVKGKAAELQILLDGKKVGQFKIVSKWRGKRQWWEPIAVLLALPAGSHRISVRLLNPRQDPEAAEPLNRSHLAAVDFFALQGPFSPAPQIPSRFLRWLIGKNTTVGLPLIKFSGEDLTKGSGKSSLDTGKSYFTSNGYRHTGFAITTAGKYRFRVKAGAQQAGDEPVKFEIRLGDKPLKRFTVTTKGQTTKWFEIEAQVPAGEHDLQIWFVNEFRDEQTKAQRWLWVHELAVEGPIDQESGIRGKDVPALLAKAGRILFRRPLTDREKQKLIILTAKSLEAGQTPMDALRLGLQVMLASPKFLYWDTTRPQISAKTNAANKVEGESVFIDEYALASRLSSFLWSSIPDEALLQMAERKMLRKNLPAQVQRMLADPRAGALTEHFAGQWLQLRDVTAVKLDAKTFPKFNARLARDMKRESELLFQDLLKNNKSVLGFLSADYTFINERLADHYGFTGVKGEKFRRFSLAGTPRRGILAHASILTLTSHPTRTAPVKRGKFVLEKILGTPPPPPPKDIPPLKDGGQDVKHLSLRKQLEAHRKNPACAACHAFLDPMGFALENYDAIGRWRDTDGGQPIDTSAQLITGQKFKNLAELQAILLRDRKDDFVRTLAENLLTYALGRGLQYTDKPAVREIVRQTRDDDYRFGRMILAICQSVPFGKMRSQDAQKLNQKVK